MRFWQEAKGDVDTLTANLEIILEKKGGKLKLPDGVANLQEMLDRNTLVLQPILFNDLTNDQRKELVDQFDAGKISGDADQIMYDMCAEWDKLFSVPPILGKDVQAYFKVSSII
jgi:hypothetical protein